MKLLQNLSVLTGFIFIFTACQPGTSAKQSLSKPETRMAMMNQIAGDSSMSNEMMKAMMSGSAGREVMQEHQMMMMHDGAAMMKMMNANPDMMQKMKGKSMDMNGMKH